MKHIMDDFIGGTFRRDVVQFVAFYDCARSRQSLRERKKTLEVLPEEIISTRVRRIGTFLST